MQSPWKFVDRKSFRGIRRTSQFSEMYLGKFSTWSIWLVQLFFIRKFVHVFSYKHNVYKHNEAQISQKLSISLAYFLASLLHVAWHLCIIKILIHHSFWNEYTFCVLALIKDPKYNEILNKTKKIFKGAKIHHNDSRFA